MQLEIYLMNFPFSDLSKKKVRPVVVISNEKYNLKYNDVLVIPITSNIKKSDFSININNDKIIEGFLYEESSIRCDKLFTCDKAILIKKIATLKEELLDEIKNKILKILV